MAGDGLSRFLNAIGWEDEAAEKRESTSRGRSQPAKGTSNSRSSTARSASDRISAGRSVPAPASNPVHRDSRSSSERIQAARPVNQSTGGEGVRMVVLQPRSYEEATMVADQLKLGKPVIMNLEGIDREVGVRILDFAIGASYAVNGTIRRVSKGIFFVAPEGVDISGTMTGPYYGK